MDYLKAYSEAMRDGDITEREKTMLATFANAYGLNEERVTFLENYYDSNNEASVPNEGTAKESPHVI